MQDQLLNSLQNRDLYFTPSNLLSLLRLFCSVLVYILAIEQQTTWLVFLTLFIVFTDYADGFLARVLNQKSELGKILDPLADKACVILGVFALYQAYDLPFWVLFVVVGRDLFILLGAIVLIRKMPYVPPAGWPGKIAVTIIAVLFLVYVLQIKSMYTLMHWLTFAGIVYSSAYYGYRFYDKSLNQPDPS